MGAVELKVTLLAGLVGGAIMVLAEMIAMHQKVKRYRDHLRALIAGKRYLRLLGEGVGVLLVAMIQPALISILLLKALDNFTPEFSQHAVHQLQQGVQQGNLDDERTLKGRDHM